MKKVEYKKQIGILSTIAILGIIFGMVILCQPDTDLVCRGIHDDLSLAVWLISATVLITLIPLYFTKEAVYKTWRKFAIIYLPIVILLIAMTKPTGGAAMFAFDREIATITFSVLFLIISFLIITIKSFKLRKK